MFHRKGMLNKDADALSCRQNTQAQETTKDLTSETIKAKQLEGSFIQWLVKSKLQVPFQRKDGVLFHGDPSVIVLPSTLQQIASRLLHDHLTAGHVGRDGTTSEVKDICWWPSYEWPHQGVCPRIVLSSSGSSWPISRQGKSDSSSIVPSYVGKMWATDIATLPESQRGNKFMFVIHGVP